VSLLHNPPLFCYAKPGLCARILSLYQEVTIERIIGSFNTPAEHLEGVAAIFRGWAAHAHTGGSANIPPNIYKLTIEGALYQLNATATVTLSKEFSQVAAGRAFQEERQGRVNSYLDLLRKA
jgi:hypothetical protein